MTRPRSATGPAPGHPSAADGARARRATIIGASAIVMWSALAILTTTTTGIPPFLLVSLAFGVAFAATVATWIIQGGGLARRFRWPFRAWLVGVGGLFGYHVFYFIALHTAPPAQANLLNYLWPLLIVVISSLLPGERLRWWHVGGALLGLIGTVLLITDGGRLDFHPAQAAGYAAALACAFTWAGYSILSRLLANIPTAAVGAFCGATAVLAAASHLAFERTVWPEGAQWLAVLVMGLGPVGGAFFAWDEGMKRGDIRVLGACAYLTPLLSTGLLVAFGRAEASRNLVCSAVLITAGAVLASRDILFRRLRIRVPSA